jgi:hypothetical protein
MSAKLTKFPVTAPDGTEYCVTIVEEVDLFGSEYVELKVYTPRKRFRYRNVYNCEL